MEDLSFLSRQESGMTSIKNFEELKQALEQRLAQYDNVVYAADGISDAKRDKAELNKLRRSIEERRKEIRRNCLEPYTAVEPRFKELVALIDQPLSRINQYIAENSLRLLRKTKL